MTNNRQSNKLIVVIGITIFIISGCAAERERVERNVDRSPANSASQRFTNKDFNTIRSIAQRIFRQYYRVDPRKSSENAWISYPTEVTETGQPQRLRDTLTAFPSRRRCIAELRIVEKGPDVLAVCRVRIQRLDTTERAAFTEHRGDDRPTDTPIDRLGATSANTREDWVETIRDRKAERMLLDSIQKQIE
ncbi:MAG: hypothetical protein JSV03_06070 [Planctomycetota bacterium]|nr:MAG: hypothetical protein JSV03_06070 [Planctomycetota bacterium]